jgi:hypothetical protein
MLFDNRGSDPAEGRSRVVEIDPASGGGIVWDYRGTRDIKLQSDIRSSQEFQPNGNVLITESDGGRLLEVTRSGEIVWEFVNPVRVKHRFGDGPEHSEVQLIPVVSWGQRIDIASLQAGFRSQLVNKRFALWKR